jgi:hypothetical protein
MIIFWNACVGVTKLSIAFFYKRIFGTVRFRKLSWAAIALLMAWTIAFVLVGIFPCSPVSDGWSTNPDTNCIDGPAMYTAGVASNIALDILILVIPIYQIWKLHMPMLRKLGVAAIFTLASFVIVTGIIRLVLLVRAFGALDDPQWHDITCESTTSHTALYSIRVGCLADEIIDEYSPPMLWTVVELNLGVVCACLPLMRSVWRATRESQLVGKVFTSLASLTYSSTQSKVPTYRSFDKNDDVEAGIVSSEHLTATPSTKAQ